MTTVGYARTDAGNIVDNNTIHASYFNDEYNAILAAFDATTGHNHGGGSGQGSPIDLTISVTGVLPFANGGLNEQLITIGDYNSDGIFVQTSQGNYTGRTITNGTGITVTNGDGVAGNPAIGVDAAYVGQSSITTVGTITSGTWDATPITYQYGGTGFSLYTDGQLLIGNSSTSALSQGTITQPAAGLTVTNGHGSITLALANDLAAIEALSGTGLAVRTGTSTWGNVTITGTANLITVTNGDGVSGAPTLTVGSHVVRSDNTNTLTVGYAVTPSSLGTVISGTVTPNEANGAFQYATNGGAHTLAPPTNATSLVIEYTNNGSAGAVATSGFTKVDGVFDTINGDKFLCYITKSQNYSYLNIVPLQ